VPGIAESLREVRARIAAACGRAGRDPAAVTLVAVAKSFPVQRIDEALACGQRVFGENRVQEALAKIWRVSPGARWHLVGHLQRNKARQVVGRFELIHSLDGEALARELDRRAAAAGIVQGVLIEVNVAREATKHGVDEEELERLLDAVLPMAHLEVRGLMAIPPPPVRPEDSRGYFARLREARDRCASRFGRAFPELSMGMTDDYEVAIEEGATLVRIGRAIFGERP
jgi:hypothetical protein